MANKYDAEMELNQDGILDLKEVSYLSNGDSIVEQAVRLRLFTFMGDWWLDKTVGIPIIDILSSSSIGLAFIEELYRSEINSVDGVLSSIVSCLFDPSTQNLVVNAYVTLTSGDDLQLTFLPPGALDGVIDANNT